VDRVCFRQFEQAPEVIQGVRLPRLCDRPVFCLEAECNVASDRHRLHAWTMVGAPDTEQHALAAQSIDDLGRSPNSELGATEPTRLDIENFRETMVCVALSCGTQDRNFKKINASNGMNGAARQD
jgi:hypothetical protein